MKTIWISIVFLLSITNSFAQVIEVEGELLEDTVWDVDTVILLDHVFVPVGKTLRIFPNTVVQGEIGAHIEVKGVLLAEGTATSPILFTALDTTGFIDTLSIFGTWSGIHFIDLNEHSDSSILDYCIIEYGGAFDDDIDAEKRLNNGGGIYIDNSSRLRISNNVIQKNKVRLGGGGIYMRNQSSPYIKNNVIRNNTAQTVGGGIRSDLEDCAPIIEKNLIIENYAFYISSNNFASGSGGGLGLSSLSHDSHALVFHNIISNNKCVGGAFYESTWETKFISNIVCNNIGDAVFNGHQLSSTYIVNNTIVNNHSSLGEAIGVRSDNLNVYNNIIQNNWNFYGYPFENEIANVTLINELQGKIRYNNIGEIDLATGLEISDNIDVAPVFVAPTIGIGDEAKGYLADWSLVEGDANIDAGSMDDEIVSLLPAEDVYGNPRIDGLGVDIGAVEYQITVSVEEEDIYEYESIGIYPNPFSGVIWIENNSAEPVQILIHDVSGQLVYSFSVQGAKIFQLNTTAWATGTYICQGITSDKKVLLQKKIIKN